MPAAKLQLGRSVARARWLAVGLLLSCGGDKGFSVIWEISPPGKASDCGPPDPIDSVTVRVLQNDGMVDVSKQITAGVATFFQEPGVTNQVMAVANSSAKTLTLVVDGLKADKPITQIHDMVTVSGTQQVIKRVQLPVPPLPANLMCDPLATTGSNGQKCIYTIKTAATMTMPPVYEFRCGSAGAKMRGEHCGLDTECSPGTLCGCLGTGATPPCTCRKFCESGQDARDCGMPNFCDVAVPGTVTYRLCLDPCTPFTTMCPDSGDCKVLGGLGKVACVAVGTNNEGERCATGRSSDCARGLACFPPTTTCQKQCDPAHPCMTGMCMGGICSGSAGAGGMGAGGMGAGGMAGGGGLGGLGGGGAGGSGVAPLVVGDGWSSAQPFSSEEAWPLQ